MVRSYVVICCPSVLEILQLCHRRLHQSTRTRFGPRSYPTTNCPNDQIVRAYIGAFTSLACTCAGYDRSSGRGECFATWISSKCQCAFDTNAGICLDTRTAVVTTGQRATSEFAATYQVYSRKSFSNCSAQPTI